MVARPALGVETMSLRPEVAARAIALRREIHRFPELGFEEERTASLVERELDSLGIAHRRVAKTGVVGVIRGAGGGKVAGLRADMDALPVDERSGEPFSSEVPGKMHACGHDAHTAILLGAAHVLQAHREKLGGDVVLLFQPAEEGPGGALPMIDVEGVGGHGASPHTAVDAIPCAAAIVLALQNIAARETDPLKTVVVTIGTIEGGYRNNIIADRVTMSGTFRSQDQKLREALEGRARRIIEGVAAAYGARATIRVNYGYPPVRNDAALSEAFREYAASLGFAAIDRPPPTMGGEDFAYFAERVPGVMVRLGIRNEAAGSVHPGHSPLFRIDEDAIAVGIETLAAFARGVGSGAVAVPAPA